MEENRSHVVQKFSRFFLAPVLDRGMVIVQNCRITDGSTKKIKWGSPPTLGNPHPPPQKYFFKIFPEFCLVALWVSTVEIWCCSGSPLQRYEVFELSQYLKYFFKNSPIYCISKFFSLNQLFIQVCTTYKNIIKIGTG